MGHKQDRILSESKSKSNSESKVESNSDRSPSQKNKIESKRIA